MSDYRRTNRCGEVLPSERERVACTAERLIGAHLVAELVLSGTRCSISHLHARKMRVLGVEFSDYGTHHK